MILDYLKCGKNPYCKIFLGFTPVCVWPKLHCLKWMMTAKTLKMVLPSAMYSQPKRNIFCTQPQEMNTIGARLLVRTKKRNRCIQISLTGANYAYLITSSSSKSIVSSGSSSSALSNSWVCNSIFIRNGAWVCTLHCSIASVCWVTDVHSVWPTWCHWLATCSYTSVKTL